MPLGCLYWWVWSAMVYKREPLHSVYNIHINHLYIVIVKQLV